MKQTLGSFKTGIKNSNNNIDNKNNNCTNINSLSNKILHTLNLTYKDDHSTNLIKSIKTSTKKSFLEKHDVMIILRGTKLRSQFNIKNDTNKQYKHDLVYFSRCPSTTYTDSYIGQTAKRLNERLVDHSGRGTKAHVVRHCFNTNHETVNSEHFNILDLGYNKNAYRRRIY